MQRTLTAFLLVYSCSLAPSYAQDNARLVFGEAVSQTLDDGRVLVSQPVSHVWSGGEDKIEKLAGPGNSPDMCPITVTMNRVNASCTPGCDGTLTATPSGGSGYTYSWSNGRTTQTITGICNGNTYTVTVRDGSGSCSFTYTTQGLDGNSQIGVKDTLHATLWTLYTHADPPGTPNRQFWICQGECVQIWVGEWSGGIVPSGPDTSTGGPPYTYTWSLGAAGMSGPGPHTFCPTVTTSYRVTIRDQACLTVQITSTPQIMPIPNPTINITSTPILCNGDCSGSFNANISGGSSPYTYVWGPGGQTTSIVSGLCAGTHTLSVTDSKQCQNSTTRTITEPPPLVITANPPVGETCTGMCNGQGSFSVSGGTPGYSYNWSNSGSGTSVTGLCAGTYTVTVTDANGCTDTDNVTITANPPPIADAGPDITICPGGSTQFNATGGTTYLWSPATGLDNPNIANPRATPSVTTTYTVTVTDANGCTDTDDITVNVGGSLTVTTTNAAYCPGGSTVLSISAPGGVTYSWSPPTGLSNTNTANPTASPTVTTTYTVTVTDASGCSGTGSLTVTVHPLPTANAGPDAAYCAGGSTQLNGGGGGTYLWSPATGLSNTNIANPVASPTATTTYTVTVTDANGCTDTDDVIITVNPPPVADAGPDVAMCPGGSTQFNATGGTTYLWSPAAGLDNPNIANPTATPTATTTYTVTVTDANGCTDTDDITVNVGGSLTVTTTNAAYCQGGSTVLSISAPGGVTYSWSPATGLSNTNTANPTASPTVTTTYTVTVTDAGGCSGTGSLTVTVYPLPTANAGPDAAYCAGGSSTLNASGGVTYSWSPATGLSNTNTANPTATPTATTTYTVTVTDANGCIDTDDVTITVNPPPVADAGPDVALCAGDNTQLNASGGVTYAWSPPSGLSSTVVANPTATPTATTTYTVTVTDANGCTDTDDVTLTVNPAPNAQLSGTDVCLGAPTVFTNQSTGGSAYLWSFGDGSTSSSPNPTYTYQSAGTYNVCLAVTSAGGCVDTACTAVIVNPQPVACFTGGLSGCGPVISVPFTNCSAGGTSCLWDFGDGTTSTSCSPTHDYSTPGCKDVSLTVTNAAGCTDQTTTNCAVEIYPGPKADFDANPTTVTILNPVIDFFDKSSTAVSWQWDFGDGDTAGIPSPTHTYADTGSYLVRLIIVNQYGCVDTILKPVVVTDISALYIPNAFTPNQDGDNEGFRAYGYGIIEFELFIFDRWGNLIFETKSMSQSWDGTANGGSEIQQEDVYVWLMNAKGIDNRQYHRIGTVTLIR